MTSHSRSARAFAASSTLLFVLSCGPRPAAPPSIEFTTIPRADAGGPGTLEAVAGRVHGARSDQRVVVFARSGGVWWVQPFRSRPFTDIDRGSTWKNSIHLGTEYAALLVDADYRPPATIEALPRIGGGIAAVAHVGGSGTFVPPPAKTLSFSGYDWEVRQQPGDRHGLNEFDARNAWVDADGHLHLALNQRDGRWTSAEVRMTRSLAYGTYAFDLRDASALDPSAVFSMYIWDALGADQNYRELTIDVGKWSDPARINGHYIVQPETIPANVFRFTIPGASVTHSFRWEPGRVEFKTARRADAARGDGLIAERLFTSGVPTAGSEKPHFTLLYDHNAARPPSKEVEVVVERFAFLP